MSELPKIAQARLGAKPAGPHPEADLLTAFAEQALKGAEREGVLAHLAMCADCRDIVALCLPPQRSSALPLAPEKGQFWNFFDWKFLRLGTAVASVVVIAGVVSVWRDSQSSLRTANETMQTRQGVSAPAAPEKQANPGTDSDALSTSRERIAKAPAEQREVEKKQAAVADDRAKADNKTVASASVPVNGRNAYDLMSVEKPANLKEGVVAKDAKITAQAAMAPMPAAGQVGPAEKDRLAKNEAMGRASGGMREGESADSNFFYSVTTAPQSATVVANAPAADKSKPAAGANFQLESSQANTQSGTVQSRTDKTKSGDTAEAGITTIHPGMATAKRLMAGQPAYASADGSYWRINNDGRLEFLRGSVREQPELDARMETKKEAAPGEWKQVTFATPAVFHGLAIHGAHIWAGGSDGMLQHSNDNGKTWAIVKGPWQQNTGITIIAVSFTDDKHGQVTTSTGERWMTSDGGENWKRP